MPASPREKLKNFISNYSFQKPALLRLALTHRSFSADHNERLEFLGDTVLNCIVSEALYRTFPDLSEGKLSHLRASLVNRDTLLDLATRLNLGPHLYLGMGEQRAGGAMRPSILADTVEAIIGAIFLDGGFAEVQRVVQEWYHQYIQQITPNQTIKDAKTTLQEWLQGRKMNLPNYQIQAISGDPHEQLFTVVCLIEELSLQTEGQGTSRRMAEQRAAEQALQKLSPPKPD